MNQVVIGTAGHIDHGKTALVKALTGVDTDRLSEEQKRGMTIDLGFAFLNDRITIIDVPGHERFIRNMVAGVSTIDFVILVVALDDGIMPQTMEHLNIIDLLGVPDGIIVLTKCDLISDNQWVELVEEDIREKTKGTVLEGKSILKTSSVNQMGVDTLKDALINLRGREDVSKDDEMFRLQIDRVFQKTGFGIIVTGTVIGGGIKVGSQISIQPMNKKGKVRGLQSHGKDVEFVSLGDRAAVNITGIDYSHVWRGAEIVSPNSMNQTTRMIANIHLIKSTHWKLIAEQRIRIHVGTSDIIGKVIFIPKKISAGESINVIMELEKPISIALDDRFIIRSYSPTDTIGGGIILDQNPLGSWTIQKKLCQKLSLNIQERFLQFVNATTKSPFTTQEWSKKFSKSEKYITKLIEQNRLKHENGFVFSQESQSKCQHEVIELLSRFHRDHPYRDRFNLESARSELGYSRNWFDFIISQLEGKEVSVKNGGVALISFKMEIQNHDMEDLNRIKNIFQVKKFLPVSVNEIGVKTSFDPNKILEFLHILKRKGETINISDQFWMSMSDWILLIQKLETFFKSKDVLNVSDFKSITDLSRKTAIPLLEYLDKIGITSREGNERLKGINFSTNLNQ